MKPIQRARGAHRAHDSRLRKLRTSRDAPHTNAAPHALEWSRGRERFVVKTTLHFRLTPRHLTTAQLGCSGHDAASWGGPHRVFVRNMRDGIAGTDSDVARC